jgi:hypothetical protein
MSPRHWRIRTITGTRENPSGFPVQWRTDRALPPHWHSVLDGEGLPYIVELDFVADHRGPVCVGVRLGGRDSGEPISPRRLRAVPLGECIQIAIADAVIPIRRDDDGITFVMTPTRKERDFAGSMEAARSIRPRSANTGDEHLREVAAVYLAAPEKPTQAVERAFGPISHSTAARWVGEARRRGFIPPAKNKEKKR